MADSGRLDKIDYGVALESFKDSSGLIFVFGPLFQSPLKKPAHLVYRSHSDSFRVVSSGQFVLRVSRGRKDNCTPRANSGCHRASCSGLHQGHPRSGFGS